MEVDRDEVLGWLADHGAGEEALRRAARLLDDPVDTEIDGNDLRLLGVDVQRLLDDLDDGVMEAEASTDVDVHDLEDLSDLLPDDEDL